jgi:signal transduction histidine kinase/ligand-binding sensor domain-containing protein
VTGSRHCYLGTAAADRWRQMFSIFRVKQHERGSLSPTQNAVTRRRLVLGTVTLACVLALPAASAAASRLFDEYALTSWTDDEGLFGGWIVGLAQDSHGYLWIGTVSGLIRFDGLNFERPQGTDATPLPQRSVSAVYGDRHGGVWVGFGGGVGIYRMQDQEIRGYGTSEGLAEGRTLGFVEDVDGTMLAVTVSGLYRLINDRWYRLGSEEGLPDGQTFAARLDRAGALWAATSEAIVRRPRSGDRFREVNRPADVPLALSESADGAMWGTSRTLGYRLLESERREPLKSTNVRRGNGHRLLHDRAGNLWVATLGQGLWFQPNGHGTLEVVDMKNGLSNDTVRSLFEDRNGDVWVGTTVGLHRFARRRVTPITDLGVVKAVEAGPDGTVWVGTSRGLVRFFDGVRRRYGTRDGLPSDDVRSLHIDDAGSLWVSTAGGVARLHHDKFATLPLAEGAWPSDGNSSLATDATGGVWLSSEDHGLVQWRDSILIRVAPSEQGGTGAVHSVSRDRKGQLWLMLAGGGLGLIDRHGAVALLRDSDKYHRSDLAVHEDDGGTMWFGSGERLTRFKDGGLSELTGMHGLPAAAIRSLVTDKEGNLWVGTSGGILRVTPGEIDRALADSAHRIDFRSYNPSDGLAGAPVRVGSPSAVRGADGKLWFVTGNGITILDPQRLSAARPALPVRIERITANGRSFEPSGVFTLPPRTTGLQIDYTALEFFSPREVQFRYRLEGLDDEWIEAGSRRQALFTNLPPRHYRFQVSARSSEGIWSEQGDAIEFAIQPMFYQTRWFEVLCTMVAVGMAFVAIGARRRQVRRRFDLVLAERVRMARELHDTLLQSLAGLELQMDTMASQLDDAAMPVKQQLDRVRRQIQSDVSEARQSIWALRSPTLQTADLAVALRDLGQALASSTHVRFECAVSGAPSRCAQKVEEHVLRVGREALMNAIRHAQATVVRLHIHYDADSVSLRVSDDGRGFDVSEARTGGTHWGLETMRERAAAIGGRLTLVSRPGEGTHLEMIAPRLSRSNV